MTTEEIKRIYHYEAGENVLTLRKDGPYNFINSLEQVHSFIDCCHDQFDPSRMSVVLNNTEKKNELKRLIWQMSFGYGSGQEVFKTNNDSYDINSSIHKLAHALERTPQQLGQFSITLPNGSTAACNYVLPEFIELPWDSTPITNSFATYKFHNYNPVKSGTAGSTLKLKMNSENRAFILDCGKRLFHENYTANNDKRGFGTSIFSGIIDSSTVNDKILNISDVSATNMLQFLIPFIHIPTPSINIYMYCTFADYNKAVTEEKPNDVGLFLSFLTEADVMKLKVGENKPSDNITDISNNYTGQYVFVKSAEIPNLTDVTNFLASNTDPNIGCFLSLRNTFFKTSSYTNPCSNYNEIMESLYKKIESPQRLFDFASFQKMFQIRFKHIGDKTRLMDAVIINSLSAKFPNLGIPLCHTATIDTFSNRYAMLGNLYTIMPIKKSNLYVNDNKVLTAEQLSAMEEMEQDRKQKVYEEEKLLFQLINDSMTQLQNTAFIMQKMLEQTKNLLENKKKRVKKTRTISCLLADYWDVNVTDETFINNVYTQQDLNVIELFKEVLVQMSESFKKLESGEYVAKMQVYYVNSPSGNYTSAHVIPLSILLDLLRLHNLIQVNGITIGNNGLMVKPKNNIMHIATSVSKSDFSPEKYKAFNGTATVGGNVSANKMSIDNNNNNDIYSDDNIEEFDIPALLSIFDITVEDTTITVANVEVLDQLRRHFVIDKIKHEMYENDDYDVQIMTLDENTLKEKINIVISQMCALSLDLSKMTILEHIYKANPSTTMTYLDFGDETNREDTETQTQAMDESVVESGSFSMSNLKQSLPQSNNEDGSPMTDDDTQKESVGGGFETKKNAISALFAINNLLVSVLEQNIGDEEVKNTMDTSMKNTMDTPIKNNTKNNNDNAYTTKKRQRSISPSKSRSRSKSNRPINGNTRRRAKSMGQATRRAKSTGQSTRKAKSTGQLIDQPRSSHSKGRTGSSTRKKSNKKPKFDSNP